MSKRSALAVVRNPVLGLSAFQRLALLPKPTRCALAALLDDLARDARARAEKSWRTHKAPMAVYWKAVAVYARHTAKALRQDQQRQRSAA